MPQGGVALLKAMEELQAAGKFEELRQIEESSYPYWEKWKYLAKEWSCDPKKVWGAVKGQRYSQKTINFSGLEMHLNTPSFLQEQLHDLDMNLGGSLHTSDLIPTAEKQRYLVSSLMEEAIASSQLEGAATTRKLAKEMLESNRKPRNLSEQMIANNYTAMQWIVDHKDVTMTPDLILQIHQIITSGTLPDGREEGAFRTSDDVRIIDVQTGTILHTPPPSALLEKLMTEFCIFANDQRKENFFLHPISKAIIVHFLTGYIHPFADGNGRTARALFYWYLIKKGYWLIEYMSVSRVILGSKSQYARAYQYTELDENDLTYFVAYNLKCIGTALEELKKYISRKNKEKKTMLQLLRNTDYNERQQFMLQQILNEEKTTFTVSEIESKFDVSNQTARNDLNFLVEKGILDPKRLGRQIHFLVTIDAAKKIQSASTAR
ncbi:Fic family protein [Dinghuibacter silviterrae]|uniref:Fic family protein n=2 Tax=Dinghuibacter silviterrae TaxID=1539049 RepID=A0A4R8DHN6_9BACT|nr:Fic family protein [Dinghuibacter silviterrae]